MVVPPPSPTPTAPWLCYRRLGAGEHDRTATARIGRARLYLATQRLIGTDLADAITEGLGFALTGMALAQPPLIAPVGGPVQRLRIIIGWTWPAALAAHVLVRNRSVLPIPPKRF